MILSVCAVKVVQGELHGVIFDSLKSGEDQMSDD